MRLRTVYMKVDDMKAATEFWTKLLQRELDKQSDHWCEFDLGNLRLGFLLNDFGDEHAGSRTTVMFEMAEEECRTFIDRARLLGAETVSDNFDDPNLRSVVLRDPAGQEFEAGVEGTHH